MNPFALYLQMYQIDPVRLAQLAGVRYLTVWNATHGKPITAQHAAQIRTALRSFTGVAYPGSLPTIEEQATRPISTCSSQNWLKKGGEEDEPL